jgi:CheY-like chemotaxis protein
MHQGTVVPASEGIGRGSTFTITLPLDQGPDVPEDQTLNSSDALTTDSEPCSPKSVVLVEDNEDMRESMKELLIGLGHTVHTATDGKSGAELILRIEPDVAIVDLGLPVFDGYQVAAQVRSRLGRERVRLVAMTGYGQDSDRARTREAGFDTHLVKPADLSAVIDVLSGKEG